MKLRSFRLKRIFTWSPYTRKFRICRFMWECGKTGDGKRYSTKLTFAFQFEKLGSILIPSFFRYRKEHRDVEVVLFGIAIHWKRSYGGIFT